MKYLVVLALLLSVACSKTTTPSDTDIQDVDTGINDTDIELIDNDKIHDVDVVSDIDVDTDCRDDDLSRPDSDTDFSNDFDASGGVDADTDFRGDDASRPDSDADVPNDVDDIKHDSDLVVIDLDVVSDEDISTLPDDPFEDPDEAVSYDEDFELPDNDVSPLSCSSHKVCEDAVPSENLGYCYYNYCWEIGEIAWEITLYDFEIDPAYFAEKFPGVDVATIQYRIDVKYQSSGDYPSFTGTEKFIAADKLSEVVLTMFTGTPFSYRMYFFEKDPQDGAVYDVGWYVSSKVSHGEIGNGDFVVQLEMYQGPIKVKVHGRFVAYIY